MDGTQGPTHMGQALYRLAALPAYTFNIFN